MRTTIKLVDIARITVDPDVNARVRLNEEAVADYTEAMLNGATFPPIVLFDDGEKLWLADGFQRVAAARRTDGKITKLAADIRKGDRRQAMLFACEANLEHGSRPTLEDKRKATLRLLNDPEWAQWADREIARQTGISAPTVATLRKELAGQAKTPANGERKVRRGGSVYTQQQRRTPVTAKTDEQIATQSRIPSKAAMEAKQAASAEAEAAELGSKAKQAETLEAFREEVQRLRIERAGLLSEVEELKAAAKGKPTKSSPLTLEQVVDALVELWQDKPIKTLKAASKEFNRLLSERMMPTWRRRRDEGIALEPEDKPAGKGRTKKSAKDGLQAMQDALNKAINPD